VIATAASAEPGSTIVLGSGTRVQKPNGDWYQAEFFQCFDCSVMFEDPQLFSVCDSSRLDPDTL